MSLNAEAQEQQAPASTGSLLDEIMAQSRMSPETEAYDIAKQGVAAFISNIFASESEDQQINRLLIDKMLVELDNKLSTQVDEILHAPKFQEIEAS